MPKGASKKKQEESDVEEEDKKTPSKPANTRIAGLTFNANKVKAFMSLSISNIERKNFTDGAWGEERETKRAEKEEKKATKKGKKTCDEDKQHEEETFRSRGNPHVFLASVMEQMFSKVLKAAAKFAPETDSEKLVTRGHMLQGIGKNSYLQKCFMQSISTFNEDAPPIGASNSCVRDNDMKEFISAHNISLSKDARNFLRYLMNNFVHYVAVGAEFVRLSSLNTGTIGPKAIAAVILTAFNGPSIQGIIETANEATEKVNAANRANREEKEASSPKKGKSTKATAKTATKKAKTKKIEEEEEEDALETGSGEEDDEEEPVKTKKKPAKKASRAGARATN